MKNREKYVIIGSGKCEKDEKMEDLTPKEREVLEYISLIKTRDGYPPSVRDIQRDVGFKSTSSAQSVLLKLIDKGYIKRVKSKSRSLVLSDQAMPAGDDALSVPVLGVVRAGAPILAAENHMFYIFILLIYREKLCLRWMESA